MPNKFAALIMIETMDPGLADAAIAEGCKTARGKASIRRAVEALLPPDADLILVASIEEAQQLMLLRQQVGRGLVFKEPATRPARKPKNAKAP